MSERLRTLGIVLGYRPHREADRLYRVLTPDRGVLEFFVRASRKSTSKLAGVLEPVGVVRLDAALGKDLLHVTGVERVAFFPRTATDPGTRLFALTLLRFVDAVGRPEAVEVGMFSLLHEALVVGERLKDRAARLWLRDRFVWKCATLLGVLPSFSECSRCGREVDRVAAGLSWYLEILEGGLVCPVCPHGADAETLMPEAVALGRAALAVPFETVVPGADNTAVRGSLRTTLAGYVLVQLGAMVEASVLARFLQDALPTWARSTPVARGQHGATVFGMVSSLKV